MGKTTIKPKDPEQITQLTICIPAYHAADTIVDTLRSLQIQTDKRFKVLVILDGPEDEEQEKLLRVASSYEDLDLSYVLQKENGGCGHARNVGLDNCTTRYIAYLDADDLYMPYAVDQINQAIAYHFDWYAGKFLQRVRNGYIIRGNEHNTWCHGRVYNVDFLKYHNIRFPDQNRIADDFPFNILCREFGVEVREGDLPIAIYRPATGSATRADDAQQKQAYEYIKGNMHFVRTAMRERSADKLVQLPQVLVMSYFYADYACWKGWDCWKSMEEDFKELCRYVNLTKLMQDERFMYTLKQGLLIPARPYPDIAEPPRETFWDMLSRLGIREVE